MNVSLGTRVVTNLGNTCWNANPTTPLRMITAVVNHRPISTGPPQRNPAWNRIKATLSNPSQICPLSQNWALPIRQVGTCRRAESRPAKIIIPVPTSPKTRPGRLPPDTPEGPEA